MLKDVAPIAGYPESYGMLLAVLQDATWDWRNELFVEDLPPEEVTWRVRPGGQSIGAILLHMTITELFWFENFVLGERIGEEDRALLMADQIDVDNDVWPDPPAQPLSWYFAMQDRYRKRTLETVKRWPSPDTMIEAPWGNTYSPAWVLGHVIQHETYHGGQIVLLHELWKVR